MDPSRKTTCRKTLKPDLTASHRRASSFDLAGTGSKAPNRIGQKLAVIDRRSEIRYRIARIVDPEQVEIEWVDPEVLLTGLRPGMSEMFDGLIIDCRLALQLPDWRETLSTVAPPSQSVLMIDLPRFNYSYQGATAPASNPGRRRNSIDQPDGSVNVIALIQSEGYTIVGAGSPDHVLNRAILSVLEGPQYIDPTVEKGLQMVVTEDACNSSLGHGAVGGSSAQAVREGFLTARELEIALLVARGARDKDISRLLFIAPSTVKNTLSRIYEKIGGKRADLVRHLMLAYPGLSEQVCVPLARTELGT